MNKAERLFAEYVHQLYEVEYVDRSGGAGKKYQMCRSVIDASEIPRLEEKLGEVFGPKGLLKPDKFRKIVIADIPHYIFTGQTLYYGMGSENGNSVAYSVQICPWQPLDDKQKAKVKGHFPEEPISVVFSKIFS